MSPKSSERQLEAWLDTETEYRKAVKAFMKADRSRAVSKEDALALVEVRARADKHLNRYLKVVLPALRR